MDFLRFLLGIVIRHGLTVLGSWLVAQGWADQTKADALLGYSDMLLGLVLIALAAGIDWLRRRYWQNAEPPSHGPGREPGDSSGRADLRLLLAMWVVAVLVALSGTGCAGRSYTTAGVLEVASRYGTGAVYLTTNGARYEVRVNADELFRRQTSGLAK